MFLKVAINVLPLTNVIELMLKQTAICETVSNTVFTQKLTTFKARLKKLEMLLLLFSAILDTTKKLRNTMQKFISYSANKSIHSTKN